MFRCIYGVQILYVKYVHPMVKEGTDLNPFNLKDQINEKNEIINMSGMNRNELDKKKKQ